MFHAIEDFDGGSQDEWKTALTLRTLEESSDEGVWKVTGARHATGL
jgi:hypothetical protein